MVNNIFSDDNLSWQFFIAVNTSCGLPLKTLRKTPMYVCGTYLVMLVSPPGVSGSSATRSLFGGTSSLSSLKSKSTQTQTLIDPLCIEFSVITSDSLSAILFFSESYKWWDWIQIVVHCKDFGKSRNKSSIWHHELLMVDKYSDDKMNRALSRKKKFDDSKICYIWTHITLI